MFAAGQGTLSPDSCDTPAIVTVFKTSIVQETVAASSCDAPVVITVIQTTIVTETGPASSYVPVLPFGLDDLPLILGPDDSGFDGYEEITTTRTIFSTITSVVTLEPPISTLSTLGQGPYLFTVIDGTTVWLFGNTPPATLLPTPYHIAVTTFLVVPMPVETDTSTTSISTVYVHVTSVITKVFTMTLTESGEPPASTLSSATAAALLSTPEPYSTGVPTPSISTAATSTKAFTVVAAFSGWNFTSTQTHLAGSRGYIHSSGSYTSSITPADPTATKFPVSSACSKEYPEVRQPFKAKLQVRAWVTATVMGEVVSWVNKYDGTVPSVTQGGDESINAHISTVPLPQTFSWSLDQISSETLPQTFAWSTDAASSKRHNPSKARSYTKKPSHVSKARPAPDGYPTPQDGKASVTSLKSDSFLGSSATEIIEKSFTTMGPTISLSSALALTTAIGFSLPPSYGYSKPVVSSVLLSTGQEASATSAPTASFDIGSTFSSLTVSVTTLESTTLSSVTASATSTGCIARNPHNKGNFTINFDDLPTFGGPKNSTHYPPIFNPYHNLFWSEGYAYVPPPEDPYPPKSPPQLAVFVTNGDANVHSQNFSGTPPTGEEVNGQFGAGSRYASSAFWIDAYSIWVGCNNAGPADCQITAKGYQYDKYTGNTTETVEQTYYQEACPTLKNCELIQIFFEPDFRNLTSLQLVATVEGKTEPMTWFMDDVAVGWTDNSCGAIKIRDATR